MVLLRVLFLVEGLVSPHTLQNQAETEAAEPPQCTASWRGVIDRRAKKKQHTKTTKASLCEGSAQDSMRAHAKPAAPTTGGIARPDLRHLRAKVDLHRAAG